MNYALAKPRPGSRGSEFESDRPRSAVKVALFHNESPHNGASTREIRELLEHHGHWLVRIVSKESSADELLMGGPDLVVAAGDDSVVAAAARVLARRGIPLAILPMGTANNIAKSLGCDAPLNELVRRWMHPRLTPLDIGVAEGEWGSRLFFAAAGAGMIASGIAAARSTSAGTPGSTAHEPGDAVRGFLETLLRLPAHRLTVRLDDVSRTGDFLLVEALNMPSVGPGLMLSSDANPSDGYLSVVMATGAHRELIGRYLERLSTGSEVTFSVPALPARRIEIQGCSDLHVDDALVHLNVPATVSLSLESAAIEYLAGAE
jgi:diacylglycerol kinase family enzyme